MWFPYVAPIIFSLDTVGQEYKKIRICFESENKKIYFTHWNDCSAQERERILKQRYQWGDYHHHTMYNKGVETDHIWFKFWTQKQPGTS